MRNESNRNLFALTLSVLLSWASHAAAQPPGLGACCLNDERCRVDDAASCEADGGTYLGDGTNCGDVSCGCERQRAECESQLADCTTMPGDGAGLGAPLVYTDNGDGTFTDQNTGLTWEVKTAHQAWGCVGDGGEDLHAVDGACDWSEATTVWIDAINAEGGTGLGGHSDWRIPNIRELQSLADYGHFGPAIHPDVPGQTASLQYWSATVPVNAPAQAWNVNFNGGGVGGGAPQYLSLRVRAVRGP